MQRIAESSALVESSTVDFIAFSRFWTLHRAETAPGARGRGARRLSGSVTSSTERPRSYAPHTRTHAHPSVRASRYPPRVQTPRTSTTVRLFARDRPVPSTRPKTSSDGHSSLAPFLVSTPSFARSGQQTSVLRALLLFSSSPLLLFFSSSLLLFFSSAPVGRLTDSHVLKGEGRRWLGATARASRDATVP